MLAPLGAVTFSNVGGTSRNSLHRCQTMFFTSGNGLTRDSKAKQTLIAKQEARLTSAFNSEMSKLC